MSASLRARVEECLVGRFLRRIDFRRGRRCCIVLRALLQLLVLVLLRFLVDYLIGIGALRGRCRRKRQTGRDAQREKRNSAYK